MRKSVSVVLVSLCILAGRCGLAQTPTPSHKEDVVTKHAAGAFEANATPLDQDDSTAGTDVDRFSLVKQYHGDLEGKAKGVMLSAGNPVSGNAGYVAIERVTGTLQGRSGTFALQHFGTMEGGNSKMSVAVVPGTGTGQLTGIAGTLNIEITGGKHSYTFDYSLPASPK